MEIHLERLRQFYRAPGKKIVGQEAAAEDGPLSMAQKLVHLLHTMGVPTQNKGNAYLRDALLMNLEDGSYAGGLTNEMYPALAEKYITSMSGVEAGIRNALAAAWKNANAEYVNKLCEPYCDDRVPTNSLIIA